MEKTIQQQNELDKIERHVLITMFGSERIPESTSIVLKMANNNPNEYIRKFENFMLPFMDDKGIIDGKSLKKIIRISKYSQLADLFAIPDTDFYLSDICISIIRTFIPGISD